MGTISREGIDGIEGIGIEDDGDNAIIMDREDDFGMADYNLSSEDDHEFNEQEYNFIHDLDSNNRNAENLQKLSSQGGGFQKNQKGNIGNPALK